MKKGINEFGIPEYIQKDRAKEFQMISAAGFDGVEFNLDEPLTQNQIFEIKELSKKYNVKVLSLVSMHLWDYHLTSNDEASREKGKDIVKMLITAAKELGADSILVVPGVVNPETSYQQAYNNAFKSLSELKDFINDHKINVGVENVWNKFLLSPLEMRDFIDKLDCKYIGSYFDAGNVLINSYPEYWVEILGKRIKKVHIKDFKRSVGNIEGFVDLMEGDMEWDKLMSALKKTGYDDFITVEVPFYKYAPQQFLNDVSGALDVIFSL